MVDTLFWLDARSLLPPSPTLLDIASPDSSIFPSFAAACEAKPAEERGLWNALSSLFAAESVSVPVALQQAVQEAVMACNVEDLFTKSNRLKVNAWIVLFNALISQEHALAVSQARFPQARLTSLYLLKLHWVVLLLSKNVDRISMVWGLVLGFFERVRSIALEMVRPRAPPHSQGFNYVLERLVVEVITLANILLNKPQLADQALALIALLEPVPPHACLSSRRVAGIYFLLDHLYPYLSSPSKWKAVLSLLYKDANNEVGRPLVWQVLCRLLQEKARECDQLHPRAEMHAHDELTSLPPLTPSRRQSRPVLG